jgi:NAD(P)-dependent dehydrogenase (short-subunit alcohol dehydrogenase family)
MNERPNSLPEAIPGRLRGKIALITGAAGNIGYETARRFLLEGAKVALIDIDATKLSDAEKKLHDAVPEAAATGDKNALAIKADVTSEEDVKKYVDETVAHFGGLDIAFLSAGMSYSATSILDTDVELWDKVINVNTRSGMSSSASFLLKSNLT